MRLGDLDALKNVMKCNLHSWGAQGILVDEVMKTIDNAPTVEPCYQTTSCLDCKNYDKETHNCPRYCEVIKEAIKSRPQGEWINHRNDNGHNIADCSLCGKATQWHDEDEDGIPRYCWYCGADMRLRSKEHTDPIIKAIQENNAKYNERPSIDFSRMSYDLGESNDTSVLTIDNMTVDDIVHWCATHPNPETKKQYEEELSRAKKLNEVQNELRRNSRNE